MANDEEYDAIRLLLGDCTERIRRRLHQHNGIMPKWLGDECSELARRCFRAGRTYEHTKTTVSRDPWSDDAATPLVYHDEDDGR